jgi:hypothetical protein
VISRTASLLALIVSFSVVVLAQGEEFARVLRNGSQATLSVFGVGPADLVANKLVDEFGAATNIEDPAYLHQDDVREVGVVHSELRFLVPRASSLEMRLNLRTDGSLLDIEARDEVARTALLRLLRLQPARARMVRDEHSGTYHLGRKRSASRTLALGAAMRALVRVVHHQRNRDP